MVKNPNFRMYFTKLVAASSCVPSLGSSGIPSPNAVAKAAFLSPSTATGKFTYFDFTQIFKYFFEFAVIKHNFSASYKREK